MYVAALDISFDDLAAILADFLMRRHSSSLSVASTDSIQEDIINQALTLLPTLEHGLDVNVAFHNIDAFDPTPSLALFEAFEVPLYHGWVYESNDEYDHSAVGIGGDKSLQNYNQIVEAIVDAEDAAMELSRLDIVPKSQEEHESSISQERKTDELDSSPVEETTEIVEGKVEQDSAPSGDRPQTFNSGEDTSTYETVDHLVSPDTATGDSHDSPQVAITVANVSSSQDGSADLSSWVHVEPENAPALGVQLAVDPIQEISEAPSKTTNDSPPDDSTEENTLAAANLPIENQPQSASEQSADYRLPSTDITKKQREAILSRIARGELAAAFLASTLTQLTPRGLRLLTERATTIVEDSEQQLPHLRRRLAVLFRNNHFAVLHLHPQLGVFTLVTDEGFMRDGGVVWESVSVDGDSVFLDAEFAVSASARASMHSIRAAGEAAASSPIDIANVDVEEQERVWRTIVAANASNTANGGSDSNPLGATAKNVRSDGLFTSIAASGSADNDLALAMALQEEEDRLESERRSNQPSTGNRQVIASPQLGSGQQMLLGRPSTQQSQQPQQPQQQQQQEQPRHQYQRYQQFQQKLARNDNRDENCIIQ
ncbi:hypothetical protein HDU82_004772 [Entophlyctis luteolus]|nr:hypothetical protein HDU82_004772 [Entophlyctis luteolus]